MAIDEAIFTIHLDEGSKTFHIVTDDFEIGSDGSEAWLAYSDASIYEIDPYGAEEPYTVTAVTWSGRRLDVRDVLGQIASAYVMGDPDYEFEQVFDQLAIFSEAVSGDIACSIGDLAVPSRYYDFAGGCVYELELVTEQAVYYTYDDACMMRSVPDYRLLSDNYFAEEALAEDLDGILDGSVEKLWASENTEYALREMSSN